MVYNFKDHSWDYGTILIPTLCAVPMTHFVIASSERPERRSSYSLQSKKNQPSPPETFPPRRKNKIEIYTSLDFRNLENMFQRHLTSELLAWVM